MRDVQVVVDLQWILIPAQPVWCIRGYWWLREIVFSLIPARHRCLISSHYGVVPLLGAVE